jgi:hypothetical protein
MEFELGIVCGRCDWYAAMGTAACQSCRPCPRLRAWP